MNIRFIKSYKSIQAEFEWRDVPNFAIITGINGVGKTQLLNAIEENDQKIVAITDDDGNAEAIAISDVNAAKQSINGLISYKNGHIARQATKKEQENLINIYRKDLNKSVEALSSTADDVERQRIKNNITRNEKQIANCEKKINQLFEYAYDKELEAISEKVGKEITNLTDEEIRANANPHFNTLTNIKDFERYVKQENDDRKELYNQLLKKGDYDKAKEVSEKEYAHQLINRYFHKFGFEYFEMQDPFGEVSKYKGKIWFKGQKGEEVEYNDLSSGEQMIVNYLFWTLGKDFRGNRINTMLLDEPDSHLHPSMCKMMVNILYELSKPKNEGGSGIRIIITTHSPSTVAFAPENNLFVMEKNDKNERSISSVSNEEAENVLSDGIFTYKRGINAINLVIVSQYRNLLFVEGKTDVIHLEKAINALGMSIDVEIIPIQNADSLRDFIRSTPSALFGGRKVMALFDSDNEGGKAYSKITGEETTIKGVKRITAEQCNGLSYVFKIQPYDALLSKYCPIEFLYERSYLDDKDILEKMDLKKFINEFSPSSNDTDEIRALTDEYESGSSLRPFKVSDAEKKKSDFADIIKNETDPAIFEGFRPTLELIQQVIDL